MSLDRVHLDERRHARTGVAEAIYAPGKSPAQIVAIARRLHAARSESEDDALWPILATRVEADVAASLARELDGAVTHDAEGRVAEFFPLAARAALGEAAVVS